MVIETDANGKVILNRGITSMDEKEYEHLINMFCFLTTFLGEFHERFSKCNAQIKVEKQKEFEGIIIEAYRVGVEYGRKVGG